MGTQEIYCNITVIRVFFPPRLFIEAVGKIKWAYLGRLTKDEWGNVHMAHYVLWCFCSVIASVLKFSVR